MEVKLPEYEMGDDVRNRIYDHGNAAVDIFGFSICDTPVFTFMLRHVDPPKNLTAEMHVSSGYEMLGLLVNDSEKYGEAMCPLQSEEVMTRCMNTLQKVDWENPTESCGINVKIGKTEDAKPIIIFNLYDEARDDHNPSCIL